MATTVREMLGRTGSKVDIRYSLKRHTKTNEIHIYKGSEAGSGKCQTLKDSVCGKATTSESMNLEFLCLNEGKAIATAAGIGRKMCGTCVSDLYETIK